MNAFGDNRGTTKMDRQRYWENIEVRSEIPTLVKHPTTRQLVKYAAASRDYYEIHYDKDFAMSTGLSGIVVQGWLAAAFLGQLITDFIGLNGKLVRFGCTYKQFNYPCDDIVCKGKVTEKYVKNNRCYIDFEIWAENVKGEITIAGHATAILPKRRNLERFG